MVDSDATELLTVSEQMFDFQEQLYKFPPQACNPQFGDFTYSFVRARRQRDQRRQRWQRSQRDQRNQRSQGAVENWQQRGSKSRPAKDQDMFDPPCSGRMKRVSLMTRRRAGRRGRDSGVEGIRVWGASDGDHLKTCTYRLTDGENCRWRVEIGNNAVK